MKCCIMVVDDSVSVLESLKWVFMDEPYYLFAFDSPLEALSVIKSLEFAVVVADQSMRKMDGLEFLKRVKVKSPHTMGIIMTGYIGVRGALDTVTPGCAYRFVKKPLDNNEIKQAVKIGITRYEMNSGSKVTAIHL